MARGLEAVPSVSAFCSPPLLSRLRSPQTALDDLARERDDCAFVLPLGENGKRSRQGANRRRLETMRGRQLCARKCKRRSTGGWMDIREAGRQGAGSMRVEHVLRECSYECNMMSSPFYVSPARSRRREEKGCVCAARLRQQRRSGRRPREDRQCSVVCESTWNMHKCNRIKGPRRRRRRRSLYKCTRKRHFPVSTPS